MKTLSCGIIINDHDGRILLGHATTQTHWDIPKGGIEPGELPIDAAVREAHEEFSININKNLLTDLGMMQYNDSKNLHLFHIIVDSSVYDINKMECHSTFFSERHNMEIPEIDGYVWAEKQALTYMLPKNLYRLVSNFLNTIYY